MAKIKRLPDAELEIMNTLWDAPAPLTAAELEAALPGTPRARTTLLTLLARLEEKGCVAREKQGRGYRYLAVLAREEYLPAETKSLLGRLFGGSPRNFVAALAETDALTEQDIDELAAYLEELKKQRGESDGRERQRCTVGSPRPTDSPKALCSRGGALLRPPHGFPLQGKPFALLSCQHLQSTTNL